MLIGVPPSEIIAARKALGELDPSLAVANEVTPEFEWRSKPAGYAGLVRLVLEQQVSVASANALWDKLEKALGEVTIENVLARTPEQLKSLGLSGQKAQYIRAVAEAHTSGAVDLNELGTLDDDTACTKLISIKGIGRWTAEAYLMGCEARTDIFPAGDLALQEAIRILDGLTVRPTTKELYQRAERWRPHRSIAAHLLWSYYTGVKKKTIVLPASDPMILVPTKDVPKGSALKAAKKKFKANSNAKSKAAAAATKPKSGKAKKVVKAKRARTGK